MGGLIIALSLSQKMPLHLVAVMILACGEVLAFGSQPGSSNPGYLVLSGSYTLSQAADACSAAGFALASFTTSAAAMDAFQAVQYAGVQKAWTAAWYDMDARTWGWYSGAGRNQRVEWHLVMGGEAGCYMANVAVCASLDTDKFPYATDCYTCDNINYEPHGFSVHGSGNMDMDQVDEQHPALCMTLA